MLSNFAEAIALNLPLYPDNNQNMGSVMDGPHVDAKSQRRVGNEERLFLIADAMVAVAGGGGSFSVQWFADLRPVGSILKMAGNRRNASR